MQAVCFLLIELRQLEDDVGLDHGGDNVRTSAGGRRTVEGSLVIDAVSRSSPYRHPLCPVCPVDFLSTVDSGTKNP